eukprot:TRINITY_DN1998_c0_g2_i2.p1 TRINITY_DN1998_c0_g2~~TRINITY_DN1998_c0_g2_i2.p1  ORF type:complete len:438 (-),score=90.68 TRINITY_DN1998_c0_g2_i2:214-1527(-)
MKWIKKIFGNKPSHDEKEKGEGAEGPSEENENKEKVEGVEEHKNDTTSKEKSASGEQEGEGAEGESSKKKEMLVVSGLDDLPEDAKKLIKQAGIAPEVLMAHFPILLNVLHFRTGRRMRWIETPEEEIPRSIRSKRSRRFRAKEEEIMAMAPVDWKKMYKMIDEAGKGGFGAVFQAKGVKDKRIYAIKKMPHTTTRQQRQNFHEAAILSFCSHKNIVRFHSCLLVDTELWIVMEFMEGGTFADAAKAWQFNEANLAYIARELLTGIKYLHDNQLVHRDLKSANIMMDITASVKLIDFGLTADLSEGLPQHMVGSPFWMPPEMILGVPHDYKVDIWSFAISLLEMANRRPPMMESALKAMFTVATEGIPEAAMFVEPEKWSDTFRNFLSLCLKPIPAERANVDDLLKHPFIEKADTRQNMESILRRIFLSNSLLDSGF